MRTIACFLACSVPGPDPGSPCPVLAENPSVMIADFTVTPSVLLPGDIGTITATIKSTATSANIQENTLTIGGRYRKNH